MAEKEKKPVSTRAEKVKSSEQSSQKAEARTANAAPWPFITIGIFASVIVLAIGVGIWWVVAAYLHQINTDAPDFSDRSGYDNSEQFYGRERGPAMGNVGLVSGVVTAIDGDTITVSGRGKQTTVKTSDDTSVTGDDTKVEVNDSVIVFGDTGDDDSVTATRIVINNEGSSHRERGRGPQTVGVPQA